MSNNNESSGTTLILCALCLFLGGVIGGNLAVYSTRKEAEQDAVKAGVAEYIADPETGDVKFVFKTKLEETK